jgi:antitoxin HigA-1
VGQDGTGAHPGVHVADRLAELGMTAAELARAMRVDPGRVSRLINGKISVTAETAVLLAEALGTKADLWLKLQAESDLQVVRRERAEQRRDLAGESPAQDRIFERLETVALDPNLFESVALDLVMDQFPGAFPVLPGAGVADGGVDGVVPRADGAPAIAVHVTTGDPVRNLKRGLGTQAREGRLYRGHIVVCNERLRPSQQRGLEDLARTHDIDLIAVYDRHWLVPQLFRRPDLTERLLGISGTPLALPHSAYLQADRHGHIELVERESEVRALADAQGHIIISGLSGVGKSRLVRQMPSLRFLRPDATVDQICDDLARLDVRTVVVDDAHANLAGLARLQEAARQVKPVLQIVAVTWPTRLDDVRDELPDATTLHVGPLPRDAIAAVLEARGITSPRALSMLTSQAQGRVGWAHHLADLVQDEGADTSVALFGDALMANVERLLRAAATDAATWDVFSAMCALNGIDGPDHQRTLANALGVSTTAIREAIRTGTALGLIEGDGQGHRVPLEPLVLAAGSACMFGSLPVIEPNELIRAFPNNAISVLRCVGWAAATSPALAGDVLAQHLTRLAQPTVLATAEGRHAAVLAAVHTTPAQQEVLVDLVEQQATERPCPGWAVELLDAILIHGRSSAAAEALVRLGLGDERSWHNTTSHPHRKLEDAAHRIDPDQGHDLKLRRLVFEAALRVLESHPGDGAERIAMAAMDPQTSGSWTTPTDSRSVLLSRGLLIPEAIRDLETNWWPELEARWSLDHLPATRTLLDSLRSPDATPAHDEALESLRRRISTFLLNHPATDAQAAALACGDLPPDARSSDLDASTQTILSLASSIRDPARLRPSVTAIAADLSGHSPGRIVDRVGGWSDLVTRATGQDWQPAIEALVAELHENSSKSARIGEEAIQRGRARTFWECTRQYLRESSSSSVVAQAVAMADPEQRSEILQIAVGALPDKELVAFARLYGEGDERLVDLAILRGQLPTEALKQLLDSPVPSIRGITAKSMTPTKHRGGQIPASVDEAWEHGWDHVPPPGRHGHDSWGICRALEWLAENRAHVVERVLNRWIDESPADHPWPLPYSEEVLLHLLPENIKLRMLLRHRGDGWVHRHLIEGMVLPDPRFATVILREKAADLEDILTIQRGDVKEGDFRTLAEVLLSAGAEPVQVAGGLQIGTFVGEESHRMTSFADRCANWAAEPGPISEVGRAGEPVYRQLAAQAEERERRERL